MENEIKKVLQEYDGKELRLMEVCGTHTASIHKNGIPSMLSEKIKLISGPGCPVCVTVTQYIDRLIELARIPGNTVMSFGDLLRVPGSRESLTSAMADGASVRMVYSPYDALKAAEEDSCHTYIFAAVGFETTTPVYALIIEEAAAKGIKNFRLLTSLKTMPEVIRWVCDNKGGIDGFIAPGHVAVISGYGIYGRLAEEYGIPFVVSGFEGIQLLMTVYALVKLQGRGVVKNLYEEAVTENGNEEAQALVNRYFEPGSAVWRGMGKISGSGMYLKKEYEMFDAGSRDLCDDAANSECHCAGILTGSEQPCECPLFGKACTPQHPVGACMVSMEGSCFNYYIN